MKFRTEKDSLGSKKIPQNAYYGIQTLRAKENFPISFIPPKPVFIKATAMIKKAAAMTNSRLGLIPKKLANAIVKAADEVMRGRFDSQFIVDVYQAGAGTSHNMNANEVIANRAQELLGFNLGGCSIVHPNDHVNMSQSTNDVMPTAMRLALLDFSPALLNELERLHMEFRRKAMRFNNIIKSGRTHLQDAVPVRLGQEFFSYATSVKKSRMRIERSLNALKTLSIGSTATGTGILTHPRYSSLMVRTLKKLSGTKGLKGAMDKFEATNSMADFVEFSSTLKTLAVELTRISNDIRLLSSGPRTGIGEIKLPAVQPGSSIMPGKVNPVMAEMLNMACFQVIGNDLAVALASQAGQLELNVMMPVINYNILQSVEILTNAIKAFTKRCLKGMEADKEICKKYFENSIALATVLNPYIGYDKAAMAAKEALKRGLTIREVILKKGLLSEKELNRILSPSAITRPGLKKVKR